MTQNPLHDIATGSTAAGPSGIPSVCSAHPLVIEASMRATLPTSLPLLIEATCNQVNQDGGYTGMTPEDFRDFVERIAAENGFPRERIILGGDHLGPNPWKHPSAEEAMAEGRGDDRAPSRPRASPSSTSTAAWAAPASPRRSGRRDRRPRRAPGRCGRIRAAGRQTSLSRSTSSAPRSRSRAAPSQALDELEVTTPEDARSTVQSTKRPSRRLDSRTPSPESSPPSSSPASSSAAIMSSPTTQQGPGPERRAEGHARPRLRSAFHRLPDPCQLADLVRDGFAILKVGPGLTFALREALYGLDRIAEELFPGGGTNPARLDGTDHAGRAGKLGQVLRGQRSELALQRHFVQRPHPLLLASARG